MLTRFCAATLLLLALAGCATAPVLPVPADVIVIETLQGGVNISLSSPAGKSGGNGVLFYRSPDSFRLSILLPFGQVLFDIIVNGEKVLCIREGQKKVWQGELRDIPDSLGVRVWPLMKWVVEPPRPAGPAVERVFTRTDGTVEKVRYDASGYVQRKVNSSGDEVIYGDYLLSGNIAVPARIDINTQDGSQLQLRFDEPEVNRPVDMEIFAPTLDGYEILPLSEFKGF